MTAAMQPARHTHEVEYYPAADGWRWRLISARNGKIVADSGEAYTRKQSARLAFRRAWGGRVVEKGQQ